MIERVSDAWDYCHFEGTESWAIVAQDTETGLYGFARLVREDGSCEEEIRGFEPDETLTRMAEEGTFDPSTGTYNYDDDDDDDENEVLIDDDDDENEVLIDEDDPSTGTYNYDDDENEVLIDEDDPRLWE